MGRPCWSILFSLNRPTSLRGDLLPTGGPGDDNALSEQLYYLNDANMNVTAVVDANATTWSSFIVERYVYSPLSLLKMSSG
jgi:hypothetical protein